MMHRKALWLLLFLLLLAIALNLLLWPSGDALQADSELSHHSVLNERDKVHEGSALMSEDISQNQDDWTGSDGDYFLQALQLYELALQGDAQSQYQLANMLAQCELMVLFRDEIVDDIAMLQAQNGLVHTETIRFLQQLDVRCTPFHNSNLTSLAREQTGSDNKDLLSLAIDWKSSAALAGLPAAIAEIPLINPQLLNEPVVYQGFQEMVHANDPAALYSLGACLSLRELNSSDPVGLILQQQACEQAGGCEGLMHYDSLQVYALMSIIVSQYSKPGHQQREQDLARYNSLQIEQHIEQQSSVYSGYQQSSQAVRGMLDSRSYRNNLLDRCTG